MHESQRLINHVALVLDGSSSMSGHTRKLIKVADEQIKHLAVRSEELKQETRVSVYLFNNSVECLIFDMDVMRLPSIADLYKAYGMTALVDATIQSQDDLATTSQIYGDHAFLTFVLTDGQENASKRSWLKLGQYLDTSRGENWTVAFLVPDRDGAALMKRMGAPEGNIAQWDTASATGINDAVSTIRTATENFMTGRSKGVRGTRSVFSTGVDAVNPKTVKQTLSPLKSSEYSLWPVPGKTRIDDFINGLGFRYVQGIGYYQLSKTETIQPQKNVIVVEKSTGKAYGGAEARHLIGLPDGKSVRVRPDDNPLYDVYIQSTSLNRNLMPNTKVLVKT